MPGFQVGLGVRDITPKAGCPLWGYKDRKAVAEGTLDPLYARTLAFRAGGNLAAVVAMDLGCPLNDVSRERVRQRAGTLGVDYVFFSATHTHHAPVVEVPGPLYLDAIEQAVCESLAEAVQTLQPARIGRGSTRLDIAHNRRKIGPDGRCRMVWRNEEKVPTGLVDSEASIVKMEALDGRPIATLVHFACHPVVMGSSNLRYSADYPGEMQRLVKEETGAECVFLQGACGDINPYLDKTPISEGAVEVMKGVGRQCAEAVLETLGGIKAEVPAEPSVTFVEKPVWAGCRWDMQVADNVDFMRNHYGPTYAVYAPHLRDDLHVPLNVLILNKELALVGMPGEIFVHYQLALKQDAPLPHSLLCGYVNGFYAYFPTVADAAAGGYGGLDATFVGLGAGDRLLAEGMAEMGRQLGRFHALCRDEPFMPFGPRPPANSENG